MSKVKKRVVETDIEKSKSASLKASIIAIIVLFIIIVGLVLFLLYDYEIIFPSNEKKSTTNKTVKRHVEEKVESTDTTSPAIINLYNNIHNNLTDTDTTIYNSKDSSTSSMSEDYKFSLAYNIYKSNIKDTGTELSIDEKDVKNAYELIFGPNTYKRTDTIHDKCNTLTFDATKLAYINSYPSDCNIENKNIAHSMIIDAKRKGDDLLITDAVVFDVVGDGITESLCQDINCNKVLTPNNGDYTRPSHYNSYIKENKDNLEQYQYTFTLGSDGFYYYKGFKRIKN